VAGHPHFGEAKNKKKKLEKIVNVVANSLDGYLIVISTLWHCKYFWTRRTCNSLRACPIDSTTPRYQPAPLPLPPKILDPPLINTSNFILKTERSVPVM